MAPLILHHKDTESALAVPSWFLTNYMPEANGDFVKVYLFLLMTATKSEANLSVAAVADELFCTESDVVRALKYWNRKGLLKVTCDDAGAPCELSFITPGRTPDPAASVPAASVSSASVSSASVSASLAGPQPDTTAAACAVPARKAPALAPAATVYPPDPDFQTLVLVAEKYLARTLKPAEIEMFANWYRDTGKNFDLIDYLVQYCVGKGVPSFSYMNKVLLNWQNDGISTVREAKEYNRIQFEDGRAFLKAFGVSGRSLTTTEAEKLDYWKNNLGFSIEMILEAARQTMNRTHGPNLEYLEKILKSWNEKDIRTPEAVKKAEAAFENAKQSSSGRGRSSGAGKSAGAPNRFHNFEQRSYDYQEWEKDLLAPYQQNTASASPAEEDWDQLLAPYRKTKS